MIRKTGKWCLLPVLLGMLIPAAGWANWLVWDISNDSGFQNGDAYMWASPSHNNWAVLDTDGTSRIPWANGNHAWLGGDGTTVSSPDSNYTITIPLSDPAIWAVTLAQKAGGAGNATLTGGVLHLGNAASGNPWGIINAERGTLTVNSSLNTTDDGNGMFWLTAPGATLVIGGNNTYSDSLTYLQNSGGSSGSPGTVKLNHANALGNTTTLYYRHNDQTVDVNGYSFNKGISVYGTYTGTLKNDSGTASTWSGDVTLGNGSTFKAGGTGNLTISGDIERQNAGNPTDVEKIGSGTLTLSGVVDLEGDLTVSAGTLVMNGSGDTHFVIGADGVNNTIDGTGTVQIDRDFVFDLSGAGTTVGDAWQIVDVPGLSSVTFGSSFTVGGFSDDGGGYWNKLISGSTYYRFDESTGELSVGPKKLGGGYDDWVDAYGLTGDDAAATNDYDSDGVVNLYEYGLGGNPTNSADTGASSEYGTMDVGGTLYFGFVHPQLTNSNSGISYSLELCTDLVGGTWTNIGYSILGTNVTGGTLDYVTNYTDTVDSQKFIRLIIE